MAVYCRQLVQWMGDLGAGRASIRISVRCTNSFDNWLRDLSLETGWRRARTNSTPRRASELSNDGRYEKA